MNEFWHFELLFDTPSPGRARGGGRRERAYRRACLWVCLFVVRGFDFFFRFATKFFVKNPPAKIDSKFYLFLAKFNQERPKSSQNEATGAQHESQKGPNGAKRAQH